MTLPAVYRGPQRLLPLFTYSSILDEELLVNLLERELITAPAEILDYRLQELPGIEYPVLTEAPGERVRGRLLRRLRTSDYERLDAYNGVGEGLYQRVEGRASVDGDGELEVYVYLPTARTVKRYQS